MIYSYLVFNLKVILPAANPFLALRKDGPVIIKFKNPNLAQNTTALIYRVRGRDLKCPINPNTISNLPSHSLTILHIFLSTLE